MLRSLSMSKMLWRNLHVRGPEASHRELRIKWYYVHHELCGPPSIRTDPLEQDRPKPFELFPKLSITTLQTQRTHSANFILVSRPVSVSSHNMDHWSMLGELSFSLPSMQSSNSLPRPQSQNCPWPNTNCRHSRSQDKS